MNKIVKRVIIFGLLGGVLLYLTAVRFKVFDRSSDDNKTARTATVNRPNALPVSGRVIIPRKMEDKINITGTIIANESVEIKSEVSGKIISIYFNEGTRVRKGDLLVKLNDVELKAQLEKLKYNKKLNEESEFRQRKLLEKEAISQEEYDIALTLLNTVEADIKLVQAQIDKTEIRAPFSGSIGLRYLSEGAYVTTNDIIASLFNLNPIKLEFSVPGKYLNKVKKGDRIYFTTESDDIRHEGKVYAVEPQIQLDTRTLKMRAISANDNDRLLPGQFVKIELVLETLPNAIMVPSEAVIPELGGHKVYVVQNGAAKSKDVRIGLRTERELEILAGLTAQDTIITSGILQIRDGSKINITSYN